MKTTTRWRNENILSLHNCLAIFDIFISIFFTQGIKWNVLWLQYVYKPFTKLQVTSHGYLD